MIGRPCGRQGFHGPRHEVRHDRVDRPAGTGNQDAGLAGGAERGFEPQRLQRFFKGQRCVHFADRTVRTDGEHALAAALQACRDREFAVGMAHVEKLAAVFLGGCRDLGHVRQAIMEAACKINPGGKCFEQHLAPGGRDDAAAIDHAHDHGLGAFACGLAHIHVGHACIGLAAGQAHLAQTFLQPPLRHADRGFGRERIGRFAEKEQVRRLDFHRIDLLVLGADVGD